MFDAQSEADDQRHFEIWRELKSSALDKLHAELLSSDEMRRFVAAQELHIRGERATFEFASSLLMYSEPNDREIAAFTLGQLGTPNCPFGAVSIPLLVERLGCDNDSIVRATAASALGHLRASLAINELCAAASDIDKEVRSNIAFALGKIGQNAAIPTLILLSHDNESSVVGWAILALRMLNINSEVVRNRFVELLEDEDLEVVEEVICGLAQWQDKRASPLLAELLSQTEINLDLLYAAKELGDTEILPRLLELRQEWGSESPQCLHDAILALSNVN